MIDEAVLLGHEIHNVSESETRTILEYQMKVKFTEEQWKQIAKQLGLM